MKNLFVLFIVSFLVVISCKTKTTKPSTVPEPGGEGGPTISIGTNAVIITATIDKYSPKSSDTSYDYDNLWKSPATTLVTDSNPFYGGQLIGNLGGYWIVLNFTSAGDVFVGEDRTNLQAAIDKSGDKKNWDPRKFIYKLSSEPTTRLAWLGRVGSGNSGTASPIVQYDKLDSTYSYPLQNHNITGKRSYSIYTDYDVIIFRNLNLQGEVLTEEKKILNAGWNTWASYIIEKAPLSGVTKGRKAWLFGESEGFGNVIVNTPVGVRFGYLKEGLSTSDYYLSGLGNKYGDELSSVSISTMSDAKLTNASKPKGKTVFTRKLPDNGNDITIFLTTVVGYNIRWQDHQKITTGLPSGYSDDISSSYNTVKDVLIEFDPSSYSDSISDGWSDIRDTPKDATSGGTPEKDSSDKTYKVPFVFIKK